MDGQKSLQFLRRMQFFRMPGHLQQHLLVRLMIEIQSPDASEPA